ncbi:MAG: hypothetical protein K0Q66_459 [Chitinophagaceae bacterium]|jgi:hypothetical protein|nr:hypothetical protein [Chitinophagaceae bacterium]
MRTSEQWFDYFRENLRINRINWSLPPTLTEQELHTVLHSMQAWQLGETSDGSNLIRAGRIYAAKINDPFYVSTLELFIKEEQKHGNNLGRFLDMIGQPRIKKNWGDTLFRKIRHFNTSMEFWTVTVITVENAAQLYYQSLKDATRCELLKEICTDILVDEAPHIRFQQERLEVIFNAKPPRTQRVTRLAYRFFYFSTILVVWFAHKRVFKAGGNNFSKYWRKMTLKYRKTIGMLKRANLAKPATVCTPVPLKVNHKLECHGQ